MNPPAKSFLGNQSRNSMLMDIGSKDVFVKVLPDEAAPPRSLEADLTSNPVQTLAYEMISSIEYVSSGSPFD